MKIFYFFFKGTSAYDAATPRMGIAEIAIHEGTVFQRVNRGWAETSAETLTERKDLPNYAQGEYSSSETGSNFNVTVSDETVKKFWNWFDTLKEE